MFVVLRVITGPRQGEVFRLDRNETFVVGRSRQAHLRFAQDDPYFSRMHFLVAATPPVCRVVDLGSRNGTMVNGQKVREAELRHGDLIRAGHTTILVELDSPASEDQPVTYAEGEMCHVPEPPPGFRFVEVIGKGGMGQVWKAIRQSDCATVALKMLLPDRNPRERDISRFLREAALLKTLEHPHIIRVLDAGEDRAKPWLCLEFIEGPDLSRLVRQQGRLHYRRGVSLMLQVLEALAYAHDRGIVHRDLKPANILVGNGPDGDHAYVADFGLARAWEGANMMTLTVAGKGAGTPHYMSPEQVLDLTKATALSDQYGAAATLYMVISGHHCHSSAGGEAELFRRILNEPARAITGYIPGIPESLAMAIHKALSIDPGQRFSSAREFAAALYPHAHATGDASDTRF